MRKLYKLKFETCFLSDSKKEDELKKTALKYLQEEISSIKSPGIEISAINSAIDLPRNWDQHSMPWSKPPYMSIKNYFEVTRNMTLQDSFIDNMNDIAGENVAKKYLTNLSKLCNYEIVDEHTVRIDFTTTQDTNAVSLFLLTNYPMPAGTSFKNDILMVQWI